VINRISSWVVHILSLFAMCLVVGATALTKIGKLHPSRDEGTAAHLFQIAVALLLPAGLVFLLSADWRKPLPSAWSAGAGSRSKPASNPAGRIFRRSPTPFHLPRPWRAQRPIVTS